MAAAPAVAGSYVVCDNGLDCVTAPCPSTNALDVQSRKQMRGIWVDVTGLPIEDQTRIERERGLYKGTLVITGHIKSRVVQSPTGPHTLPYLITSAIERPSSAEERKLCMAG